MPYRALELDSGAKLAPQGRLRKAQGASPGNKDSNNGRPEGAMRWVPVPKTCLMTSIYLELRPNSLRRPFRAFAIWTLNPGLAPWAVLLDPFGVLGFAPETSLGPLGGHEVHKMVKFLRHRSRRFGVQPSGCTGAGQAKA